MTLSFVKVLALLIGLMNHTPTEVKEYTITHDGVEYYDAVTPDSKYHLIFKEDSVLDGRSNPVHPDDHVYAIFLQDEEHTLVTVVRK
jgi:hypothetical protein